MLPQPPKLGGFANPEAAPENDPRMDPALLEGLKPFGMAARMSAPPFDHIADMDVLVDISREAEKAFDAVYGGTAVDDPTGILYTLEHAFNPDDGFKIEMHIHKPVGAADVLPAVVYLHGGGMVMLEPYAAAHRQWTRDLARSGMVGINVAYRNANVLASPNSASKYCSFPTGLNDCVVALRWLSANRARLGIGKIVMQGESGGANLTIASTMKLLRDGHDNVVDGVYAMVPYISGAYHQSDDWKIQKGLASMVECEGYFMHTKLMGLLAAIYDAHGKFATDPLAWPWYAAKEDLQHFPPTVVSVNELDPLRDEGLDFARRLKKEGVHVVSRMNLGILHGTEMMKPFLPDLYEMTIGDIRRFANQL